LQFLEKESFSAFHIKKDVVADYGGTIALIREKQPNLVVSFLFSTILQIRS
jgi:hypothetical protein